MYQDQETTRQAIEKAKRIIFSTHERTDGDDLGSVLAIANYLSDKDKEISVVIKGGVPDSLKFLPGSEWVSENIPSQPYDLLVVSGCSNKSRVGLPDLIDNPIPSINLDHHPDNSLHGTFNIVDHTKSSVAELVYDLFLNWKWKIDHKIATCLLTGIFTDTGSFRHSNTAGKTLIAAGQLMKKGGRTSTIANNTFKNKSIDRLKSWSTALNNSYYDKNNKIVYSIITQEDLATLPSDSVNYFEGVVETLNKVPEAKLAMILKQDGDIIKGSLRSDPHKGIDVKKIAQSFGGGGHVWAAGFSLIGRIEKTNGKWKIFKKA